MRILLKYKCLSCNLKTDVGDLIDEAFNNHMRSNHTRPLFLSIKLYIIYQKNCRNEQKRAEQRKKGFRKETSPNNSIFIIALNNKLFTKLVRSSQFSQNVHASLSILNTEFNLHVTRTKMNGSLYGADVWRNSFPSKRIMDAGPGFAKMRLQKAELDLKTNSTKLSMSGL